MINGRCRKARGGAREDGKETLKGQEGEPVIRIDPASFPAPP